MGSPLARVILAIFGGYLIILLFLSIHDWIVEHEKVARALQLFFRLPEPEKAAIKNNLKFNLISMEQWLTTWPIRLSGYMHGRAS
jgi:hypothetical protein